MKHIRPSSKKLPAKADETPWCFLCVSMLMFLGVDEGDAWDKCLDKGVCKN